MKGNHMGAEACRLCRQLIDRCQVEELVAAAILELAVTTLRSVGMLALPQGREDSWSTTGAPAGLLTLRDDGRRTRRLLSRKVDNEVIAVEFDDLPDQIRAYVIGARFGAVFLRCR